MTTTASMMSGGANWLESSPREGVLCPLSAKTAEGLPEVARRLARFLEREPGVQLRDLAFTYQTGKAHHAHRIAFASSSRGDLIEQCHAFASRPRLDSVGHGARLRAKSDPPRIAFLFTGQGSQYAGMGADLYPASRVFRESIDRCADVLDKLLPCPLLDVLFDRSKPARIHETELTQPALFALEYALAQQWIAWGFVPGLVLGHSLGEWVAACIGGVFSVEDACLLVFHRGSLMQRLCKRGAMLSVAATPERVAPLIERHGGGAVIAVYNTTDNIVVAGETEILVEVREELSRNAIGTKLLSVSHAFHSPLMEPMIESFAEHLNAARPAPLLIPLISNLDGCMNERVIDTAYWTQQIQRPVRFSSCLAKLDDWGADIILEIGPHPVLGKLAGRTNSSGAVILQSLRREHSALQSLHENLGSAWCAGVKVPWAKLYEGRPPKRIHVPAYPYQRATYMLEAELSPDEGTARPHREPAVRQIDATSDLAAIERVLSAVWCEVLGLKSVSPDSNFSELGADSLDAVGLLTRTKQVIGVPLTLEEQYKHRTLGDIARLLHERLASGLVDKTAAATAALEAPQHIPASLAVTHDKAGPAVASASLGRELTHVLIAGAVGYLGAHVVKELYDTTAARIDCLISSESSSEELSGALRFYFGDDFVSRSRVRIRHMRGDLADDGFGLSKTERDALATSLDVILDFTAADGSVDGARGVTSALAFLAAHPDVRLHHVSALRSIGATTAAEEELCEPTSPDDLVNSPIEAERIAGAAQRSGARVSVHRVGDLVGHSTTGRMAREITNSALYRSLRGMIEAGIVPDVDVVFDFTPVDYAASAITELAKLDSASGRTFHVCNSVPLEGTSLHDALRALGYSITALPLPLYASWHFEAVASRANVPLMLCGSTRYACATTRKITEQVGVYCPSPDRDLVARIIKHGIEVGFFTQPPNWGLLQLAFFGECKMADLVERTLDTFTLNPPAALDPTLLFNGYIGASLAYSYDQIGLFSVLKPGATASLDEIASCINCVAERLGALLKAGVVLGYLRRDDGGRYSWTEVGAELSRYAGYFTWGIGGYGKFFRELGWLATSGASWSHLRDGSMVALGSDQANAAFMRETLYGVLDQIPCSRVADLGCGNAGRLIEFCKRYKNVSAVGIDINADAIALARLNVEKNGLNESIELHCQNILQSVVDEELIKSFRDVDVVTCFMMLHDLFNIAELKDVLFDRLRTAFPNVKYFIIADTVQMAAPNKLSELPIFSIGFELLHAFMGVQIHEKSVYDEAFVKAGLEIVKCTEFGAPNTYLYCLRV